MLRLTLGTHSLVTEMDEDAKLALAMGIMLRLGPQKFFSLRLCPQEGLFVVSDGHVGLLLWMDVCRCYRRPGISPFHGKANYSKEVLTVAWVARGAHVIGS